MESWNHVNPHSSCSDSNRLSRIEETSEEASNDQFELRQHERASDYHQHRKRQHNWPSSAGMMKMKRTLPSDEALSEDPLLGTESFQNEMKVSTCDHVTNKDSASHYASNVGECNNRRPEVTPRNNSATNVSSRSSSFRYKTESQNDNHTVGNNLDYVVDEDGIQESIHHMGDPQLDVEFNESEPERVQDIDERNGHDTDDQERLHWNRKKRQRIESAVDHSSSRNLTSSVCLSELTASISNSDILDLATSQEGHSSVNSTIMRNVITRQTERNDSDASGVSLDALIDDNSSNRSSTSHYPDFDQFANAQCRKWSAMHNSRLSTLRVSVPDIHDGWHEDSSVVDDNDSWHEIPRHLNSRHETFDNVNGFYPIESHAGTHSPMTDIIMWDWSSRPLPVSAAACATSSTRVEDSSTVGSCGLSAGTARLTDVEGGSLSGLGGSTSQIGILASQLDEFCNQLDDSFTTVDIEYMRLGQGSSGIAHGVAQLDDNEEEGSAVGGSSQPPGMLCHQIDDDDSDLELIQYIPSTR